MFEPTLGTYVLVFVWFLGSPFEKTIVEKEEIYSKQQCDERAKELLDKFKRRDLGIICQYLPGISVSAEASHVG